MGYPAEEFPPRPRWPLWFTLFEDKYPEFSDEQVAEAMKVMDEGYLAQGYYARKKAKIRLEEGQGRDIHLRELFLDRAHLSQVGPVVRDAG